MEKISIGKNHVDVINVADSKEAMSLLRSIRRNTDAGPDEIAHSVSFAGLSMRDTVVAYSAFMKEEGCAQVISFEQRGAKKVPVQLALELKEGVA